MIGRSHRLEPAPASFPQQAGWGWNCYWETFWEVYTGDSEIDQMLLRMLAELQGQYIKVHHVAGLAEAGQSGMVGLDHHDAVLFVERRDGEACIFGRDGDDVVTLDVGDLCRWHFEQKLKAGNLSDEEARVLKQRGIEPWAAGRQR